MEEDATLLIKSQKQTENPRPDQCSFDALLDARDQVLVYPFNFEFNVKKVELRLNDLTQAQFYKELKQNINHVIVYSVSNIISVAFNFFRTSKFSESEAKDYSAKNILLNINNLLTKTMTEFHTKFKNQIDWENIQNNLRKTLIKDTDIIFCDTIQNLAPWYPQAPLAGASYKMKDMIRAINELDDFENDFIFANEIQIKKESGDHTKFIMTVIDKIITSTQNSEEDAKQRSVKQKFDNFNEHLFWLAQQEEYHSLMNIIDPPPQSSKGKKNIEHNIKQRRQEIINIFTCLLESKKKQNQELQQKLNDIKKRAEQFQKANTNEKLLIKQKHKEQLVLSLIYKLIYKLEKGLQEMKTSKDKKIYAIGQKIPPSIQEFNKQQKSNVQFRAKHSSILRILTKWNSNLEDVLKNKDNMLEKKDLFRNLKGDERQLCDQQLNDLKRKLKAQQIKVEKKDQTNLQCSFKWLGKLLSQSTEQANGFKVCRYSSVRTLASKMNSVLVSSTLRHTNDLIHSIIRAGSSLCNNQRGRNVSVSLVTLGIYDLLRSKLQCKNQNIFINVLQTIYYLHKHMDNSLFKIIRIKDKLKQPDNDIHINFLFMGKVPCQLQLSMHESNDKQKQYNTFSHFIYELNRGKFGGLIQCANIIQQFDPLLNDPRQKSALYQEKIFKGHPYHKWRKDHQVALESQQIPQGALNHQQIRESIFDCLKCKRFITNERMSIFKRNKLCLNCNLKENQLAIESNKIEIFSRSQRITYFSEIKRSEDDLNKIPVLMMVLNEKTNYIYLIIEAPRENNCFMVKLDDNFLKNSMKDDFDYVQLNYIKIIKQIKDKLQIPELTYQLSSLQLPQEPLRDPVPQEPLRDPVSQEPLRDPVPQESLIEANFRARANLNSANITREKIKNVIRGFNDFRTQKCLIKGIRDKNQGLIVKKDQEKWKNLDIIGADLLLQTQKRAPGLRYKKYLSRDCSSIRSIYLDKIQIPSFPFWIKKFDKLYHLSLISIEKLPQIKIENSLPELVDIKIKKCSALRHISLSQCEFLNKVVIQQCQNLSTCNLKKLEALTYLEMMQNNTIENLSLIDFSKLKDAKIENNLSLSQIKMQKIPCLSKLFIKNSKLRILSLNQFPSLKTCQIQEKFLQQIYFFNLEVLDTLNMQTIPKIQIVKLSDLPKLNKLNFSKNSELSHLSMERLSSFDKSLDLTINTELKIIKLRQIGIKTLDLSKNQKIEDITIRKLQSLSKLVLINNDNNNRNSLNNKFKIELYNLPSLQSVQVVPRSQNPNVIKVKTVDNLHMIRNNSQMTSMVLSTLGNNTTFEGRIHLVPQEQR